MPLGMKLYAVGAISKREDALRLERLALEFFKRRGELTDDDTQGWIIETPAKVALAIDCLSDSEGIPIDGLRAEWKRFDVSDDGASEAECTALSDHADVSADPAIADHEVECILVGGVKESQSNAQVAAVELAKPVKMSHLSIVVPDPIRWEWKRAAFKRDMTLTALITEAVEEKLRSYEENTQ